ncbi:MAG TPA: SCO family protein [Thermohalobaculum sp.]|nr:SCO family protein [Thermohalobaculum sp.]
MGGLKHQVFAALLAVTSTITPCLAHTEAESGLEPEAVIERSEAAIGRLVGPHVLTDSSGAPLALSTLRGRPLVISLVYTSCSSVCPVTTQHVLQAVRKARRVVGEDAFAVLTVGFDSRRDTPTQLDAFARTQGIDLSGWQLASADAATIHALLDDLGFSYDAAAGGFEHITQTTILDADGRVYRQVYGDSFPDQVFIEPLKDLIFGTTTKSLSMGDLVKRIKFLCTVYNPSSGAYEFDYAIGYGIVIGGLSLILSGTVIFRLWRGNRRLLAVRDKQEHG